MPEVRPPPECAHCGAAIPPGARACPECGADERSGWREASLYDGLDLPDAAWRDADDESGKERRGEPRRVNGIALHWWLVGLALLLLLIFGVSGLR